MWKLTYLLAILAVTVPVLDITIFNPIQPALANESRDYMIEVYKERLREQREKE